MPLKTVLFDWGGVITPSGTPDELVNKLISNLDTDPETLRAALRQHSEPFKRGKITLEEFWKSFETDTGHPVADIHRDVWTKINDLAPSPEIVDFTDKLKNNGYVVAVLSNTFPNTAADIKAMGWYDEYSPVILSSDIGMAKPDIEIYQYTLAQLGNTPDEVVFIDDQQRCLDPAAAIGMKTILAKDTAQVIRDVSALLRLA